MYTQKVKVSFKAEQLKGFTLGKGKDDDRKKLNKNSRFEGRQFSLPRGGQKYFSVVPATVMGKNDEYCATIKFANRPKKNGFGSSSCDRRDEFSSSIAIGQYREACARTEKSARLAKKKHEEKFGTGLGDQGLPEKAPKKEVFGYDQAFSHKHEDDFGKPARGKRLNHGSMRTTNTSYGQECEKPTPGSVHARCTQKAQTHHMRVSEHGH